MNPRGPSRRFDLHKSGAFVLLEAMLAVAIFALAVLALGRCVTNCLNAERFKVEDTLARRALANREAEIESGALPLPEKIEEKLTGPFSALTLKQSCTRLQMKNENGVELPGLVSVTLEVTWPSGGETQSRHLVFYVRSNGS